MANENKKNRKMQPKQEQTQGQKRQSPEPDMPKQHLHGGSEIIEDEEEGADREDRPRVQSSQTNGSEFDESEVQAGASSRGQRQTPPGSIELEAAADEDENRDDDDDDADETTRRDRTDSDARPRI